MTPQEILDGVAKEYDYKDWKDAVEQLKNLHHPSEKGYHHYLDEILHESMRRYAEQESKKRNGCPCVYSKEPCSKDCTCVNQFSSRGCDCCATYGSLEQKTAKAERLKSISSPSWVSDEEIEREGEKRYGEVAGGSYYAARPWDKSRFIKGAKWMRSLIFKEGKEKAELSLNELREGRTSRAVGKCHEWLTYCLDAGWKKEQIDGLEKIWWQHRDENGNLLKEHKEEKK